MSDALVIWCPPDPYAEMHSLVTESDQARASRFRQPIDAYRHLTGRVLARRAGATWLGLDPCDVHIDIERAGRPILIDTAETRLGAHISITHAGNLVGVVVAGRPVGIDVQDVSAFEGLLHSADIWTPTELDDLTAMDSAEQLRTAAQWWTAKEAVLKSLGRGLLDPIESLEARDSSVPWQRLDVGDDHAGAIAGSSPGRVLWFRSAHDPIDV